MIYLIIIVSEQYDHDIVTICNNREIAESLMKQYYQNCEDNGYEDVDYYIKEVSIESDNGIIWDYEEELEELE